MNGWMEVCILWNHWGIHNASSFGTWIFKKKSNLGKTWLKEKHISFLGKTPKTLVHCCQCDKCRNTGKGIMAWLLKDEKPRRDLILRRVFNHQPQAPVGSCRCIKSGLNAIRVTGGCINVGIRSPEFLVQGKRIKWVLGSVPRGPVNRPHCYILAASTVPGTCRCLKCSGTDEWRHL